MKKHTAFTLIELLVVVAIIVVLMAVLLPSLATARASAKRLQCASNMRQVGIAIQMYTAEHEGTFPPVVPKGSVTGSDYWWLLLPPYMMRDGLAHDWTSFNRMRKSLYCAALAERLPSESWRVGRHFAMNWTLGPNSNTSYWRKITRLNMPSQTILISEAGWTTTGTIAQLDTYYMHLAAGWGSSGYQGGVHKDQTNIAWADGHVDSWKNIDTLIVPPYTKDGGPRDVWFPGANPYSP